jgi:hypothetical protein
MFGSCTKIGLDPNIEIDHTGKCVAITLQERCFEVVDLIYSLDSIVGRGTRVWIVFFFFFFFFGGAIEYASTTSS